LKLLYIDDENINLMLFEALLKRHFDVTTEISAPNALQKILEEDYDVVVSDMRMPVMNGVDLIRSAHEKKPEIQYYILTAYNQNDDISRAMEDGLVLECFAKPLQVEQIKDAIQRHANS
jgi:two-component system response regulator (stage 0 sporulation protein F)